jgi:uncharacterized protein
MPPDADADAADTEFVPAPDATGRAGAPWTRVLRLGVGAFLLWLLLFAPTLQHNAQVSPVGTRRTVALDVLGPIADTSRVLQVSRLVSAADDISGRTGNRPGNGSAALVALPHGSGGSTSGSSKSKVSAPARQVLSTHPSAAHPLRVLIVGDSLGIDLGGPLQNDLSNTGVVLATLDGRESTGLTRPDYFNWPVELASDLQSFHPQVVVIMMGANDPQDFPGPPDIPYSSPKWKPMYAQRVSTFMQIAGGDGATVIWVGMPPMQNPALSGEMAALNSIDQHQSALQKPKVDFISTWKLLGTSKGAYTPFITNGSGQVVVVRTPDGIHLSPAGGEVLSQRVLGFLRGGLHIVLP